MITLKEIAQEAGVSMTTVSNVLNGNSGRVSADTAERIQAIMKKSGYVPNQAARSLAQRESHIIAVIVQASPGENIFRNPYTAEYVGALTLELQQNGYYPLIRFSDNYKEIDAGSAGLERGGRDLQRSLQPASAHAAFSDRHSDRLYGLLCPHSGREPRGDGRRRGRPAGPGNI